MVLHLSVASSWPARCCAFGSPCLVPVSGALVGSLLQNASAHSCIVLEELLLIALSNVIWRLGPEAHVGHALLDELAKLLLMAALLRMDIVAEILIIDLDETIGCLYIAALIRRCLSIWLCVRNHAHATLVGAARCIN